LPRRHDSLAVLLGIASFSLSVGFFQSMAFTSRRRLLVRWLLATSATALVGLVIALLVCLLPLLLLSMARQSATASVLAIPAYFGLVLGLAGYFVSTAQCIAAREPIGQTSKWIRLNTLGWAVSGVLAGLIGPLGATWISRSVPSANPLSTVGALVGFLAGVIVGLITRPALSELVSATDL